ncbi:Flavin-binding monooxygenase-like protein [Aspergillus sclerotialis]|uniref:Flavin-binding monooxygenase-like protein n=1 Tax=Aspergillus sclerotialis TaxID=2070753 RepID=A0A3A2ZG23_9EURO|nr:Flavin-binding monooxygenase-like protein [Aspergillus sclerotialis]
MESVDLTVVGAGWNGLAAIKTYLEVNPSSNVLLLEAASSVGGVWGKHRLYKGLKSNNMLGTYEFSDFPMDEATFGVKPGEHIPGHVIQLYLESYAVHFGFIDRICLETRVRTAEHKPDGSWLLTASGADGKESTIATKKLIMATGITSEPYLPTFKGQDTFSAPLFHCFDLPKYERQILKSEKRVAVFGGTKSAWDAVYACATSNMQVDWIIRESGHGPVWMAPAYVTPLKKWLEKLVTTRFLTWFSPCIWGEADGFGVVRRFLHGTWLGRKIVDSFWSVLANDVIQLNGFEKHPETKKLKPWVSPFWIASGLSILNYPTNIFDLVKSGAVNVHIADISHLSPNTVHLSNGETIPTTALICSTGWNATPNIKFLPEGIDKTLGFPWCEDPIDNPILKAADEEILHRFPRLVNQPNPNPKFTPLAASAAACTPHPFRLYRFIVPTGLIKERSIVFLGVTMTINTSLLAQTQALWATAYLCDRLTLSPSSSLSLPVPSTLKDTESQLNIPSQSSLDLEWDTALHTEFGKYRYPAGFGKRNPDFVFDAIPYIDLLLRDLGLPIERGRGILSRCFSPYGVEDYRGLVREWLSGNKEAKK